MSKAFSKNWCFQYLWENVNNWITEKVLLLFLLLCPFYIFGQTLIRVITWYFHNTGQKQAYCTDTGVMFSLLGAQMSFVNILAFLEPVPKTMTHNNTHLHKYSISSSTVWGFLLKSYYASKIALNACKIKRNNE